jgi:hypothetical protein
MHHYALLLGPLQSPEDFDPQPLAGEVRFETDSGLNSDIAKVPISDIGDQKRPANVRRTASGSAG